MSSKAYAASSHVSSADRAMAATLAAFSMFVVGYTAVRVFLAQPVANADTVTPHQAAIWNDGLGR